MGGTPCGLSELGTVVQAQQSKQFHPRTTTARTRRRNRRKPRNFRAARYGYPLEVRDDPPKQHKSHRIDDDDNLKTDYDGTYFFDDVAASSEKPIDIALDRKQFNAFYQLDFTPTYPASICAL